MTNEEYIDEKLGLYGDAFDFYMECGELPESVPSGDLLGEYIKSTIDANPQLDSQDPTWMEVLKDDLMIFLSQLLSHFIPIDKEHEKERSFIRMFRESSLEKQREMWVEVYQNVKDKYNPIEVNIEGYIEQFKTHEPQTVIESLTKDWEKASDERLEQEKRNLLDRLKRQWEQQVRSCGLTDYRQHKEIDKICYHYPALKEILQIIGREEPQRRDEVDDIIYKYVPILVSTPTSTQEIEQVSVGDSLSHIMPVETVILSEQATETLFYKKLVEKQLQIFANKPPMVAQDKIIQEHVKRPRLELGPIIVSIDSSGSMSGKPEQLAKCLLIQLLRMARKKHRKCFVITFSVRAKALELTRPSNWKRVNGFLSDTFSGGTDGEEMLTSALNALQSKDFCMADVLIISDFIFPCPTSPTRTRMTKEHEKGTRFYGLKIGLGSKNYDKILDRIWEIQL